MIKILKWAYNRGVRHERLRIKNILLQMRDDHNREMEQYERPYAGRSEEEMSKLSSQRKRRLQAQHEAMQMIDNLITPRQQLSTPVDAPVVAKIDMDGGDDGQS